MKKLYALSNRGNVVGSEILDRKLARRTMTPVRAGRKQDVLIPWPEMYRYEQDGEGNWTSVQVFAPEISGDSYRLNIYWNRDVDGDYGDIRTNWEYVPGGFTLDSLLEHLNTTQSHLGEFILDGTDLYLTNHFLPGEVYQIYLGITWD